MRHVDRALVAGCVLFCAVQVCGGEVTLVKDGKSMAIICVPADVMAEARGAKRGLLRESVKDLAHYLERMSGAEIGIVMRDQAPAKSKPIPILIGEPATKAFGEPGKRCLGKQGWRMVVSKKGVGLLGESDLATSYAIYEVLDRLGCRWYVPGDLGEAIPSMKTIALPETDVSEVPATLYRNIWYATPAYKRRNRLGGVAIMGAHGLENYISAEQREQHPDWNAEFGGKRKPVGRICWGNPEVAKAVADEIIRRLDKQYRPSMTLSPGDGTSFCQCEKCRALDTGDRDPSMDCVAISDRLIHFCNQIVERVTKKYPDVLFGLYAYVQYTRAPLREKPHPNIVIALAPITYCRAHSMLNPVCPSRQSIRPILEGWGKVTKWLAFRGYGFHLAEVNVPYPTMSLWSDEIPTYYQNRVRFWMPETMPTFETTLPGLYLAVRLPWYPEADPKAVLDELFTRFYGRAADPMRRYWQTMDDAWTKTPEHAGNVFGYLHRFSKETMTTAREAINEALGACQTAMEYRRVKFADDSLRQFELFMKMRWDLANGKLRFLERDYHRFYGTWMSLQQEYGGQCAFGRWQGQYFARFFSQIYKDGSRIARDFRIVPGPIRKWRYQTDKERQGEALGWQKPDFDDKEWLTTNPCVDTWAGLDLFNYFGSVWYRADLKLRALPAGKRTYVWVACLDSACKLFVNGQHIPYVNQKGETVGEFRGYSVSGSYDVTAAIKPNADNQISIIGTRAPGWLNELGTGGLMGPVLLYQEK